MDYQDNILCFYGGEEEVHNHSYFQDFPDDSKRGYGVELALLVEDIENFYERA
jgi:hypothetical protein